MVALAIGVLMHRYSLNRQDAFERLQKLSTTEGRDLEAQARLLVEAVEMLAQPANVK